MVRPFLAINIENMKRILNIIKGSLIALLLTSCIGSPQDSPQNIADTYAQSLCDMDIEGMVSCFEGGEETLGLMQDYFGDEVDNLYDIQKIVSAAQESELIPEISYEIVEEKIDGDKGTVRIRFDFVFDDGEEVHKKTDYEEISVYCHEGQWWVGEGYSKKDRELGRRFMNFMNKIR